MTKKIVRPEDIFKVTNYMMTFHCGYRKAMPHSQIAKSMGYAGRVFRDICAEIPEIIGGVQLGYYCLPLVDLTGEETRVARDILNGSERRRMIALYLRQRRQRQAIKRMEGAEKQMEFAK